MLRAVVREIEKFVADPSMSCLERIRQDADIGEVAISLGVIKPIADHKFVRNGKPDIIRVQAQPPALGLIEEGSDSKSLGFMPQQEAFQKRQGQTGIENVLDQ